MQDKEKIIINNHIQGDPLSEENLDKILNFLNEIRLLCPNKTLWLYTGYTWETIINHKTEFSVQNFIKVLNDEILYDYHMFQRKEIIKLTDVLIDGRYIDSERDVSLCWRGSKNQRVIDVQKSLQQGEVILYCE